MIAVIEQTRQAFIAYHAKMQQRSALATAEKEILTAASALHNGDDKEIDKAAGYALVLECALPELPKLLKEIKRGPDSHPIAKHIYESCKANPAIADTFRVKCHGQLAEIAKNPRKPAIYATLKSKIAGDDQERMAIDDCFKRASRGFFHTELNAIGQVWYQYRVARDQKLLKTLFTKGKSGG